LNDPCPDEISDNDTLDLNNPPPTQIETLPSNQTNQPTQNANTASPPVSSPQSPTQNTQNTQPTITNLSTTGIIPNPAQATANTGMTPG